MAWSDEWKQVAAACDWPRRLGAGRGGSVAVPSDTQPTTTWKLLLFARQGPASRGQGLRVSSIVHVSDADHDLQPLPAAHRHLISMGCCAHQGTGFFQLELQRIGRHQHLWQRRGASRNTLSPDILVEMMSFAYRCGAPCLVRWVSAPGTEKGRQRSRGVDTGRAGWSHSPSNGQGTTKFPIVWRRAFLTGRSVNNPVTMKMTGTRM